MHTIIIPVVVRNRYNGFIVICVVVFAFDSFMSEVPIT